MGGWYKLDADDARHLGTILDTVRSDALARHSHMLLYCWSQMQSKGKPCPYFAIGIRRIADECGTSRKSAEKFIARLEREGFLVNVGMKKVCRNTYVKRTFWWVAEQCGIPEGGQVKPQINSAFSQIEGGQVSEKGGRVLLKGDTSTKKRRKKGDTSNTFSQIEGGHIQSTEYSEDASRFSAGAEALASPNDAEDWYLDNGLQPPMPLGTE